MNSTAFISFSNCIAVVTAAEFDALTDNNVVIDDCSARCACRHSCAPHQKWSAGSMLKPNTLNLIFMFVFLILKSEHIGEHMNFISSRPLSLIHLQSMCVMWSDKKGWAFNMTFPLIVGKETVWCFLSFVSLTVKWSFKCLTET